PPGWRRNAWRCSPARAAPCLDPPPLRPDGRALFSSVQQLSKPHIRYEYPAPCWRVNAQRAHARRLGPERSANGLGLSWGKAGALAVAAPVEASCHDLASATKVSSLLQNPFFRESKRNRMEHEYESEREPRSILQVPRINTIAAFPSHTPVLVFSQIHTRQTRLKFNES